VADWSYKFHFRASLSLYCRSPDGAATERTQRCYGEWRDSSSLVTSELSINRASGGMIQNQDGYG